MMVNQSLFTKPPIIRWELVNIINGTSAKPIPNDRTTWLATKAVVGFTPSAMITMGGTIVIILLR